MKNNLLLFSYLENLKFKITLSIILIIFCANFLNAQCFGTVNAGSINASVPGDYYTFFDNCIETGEYGQIDLVTANTNYQSVATGSWFTEGFVTITQGSPNGPVIASGLSPLSWTSTVGGTYYQHLYADDLCTLDNSNGFCYYLGILNLTPAYCYPLAGSNNNHITSVNVIGQTTLANSTGYNSGFDNYSLLTPTVSQSSGLGVNFTVNFIPNGGLAIFIDWNNDLDFDDLNESVFTSNSIVPSTISGSFNVPSGQALGDYRMRIAFDSENSNPTSCPWDILGETEDYTFKVVPPCVAPANISTFIGSTSVTTSWSSVPGSTGYNLQYREVGAGSWTTAPGSPFTSASTLLSTLNSGSNYEVRVQNICSAGNTSAWTTATFFNGYCNVIGSVYYPTTNVTVSGISTLNNSTSIGSGSYNNFTTLIPTASANSGSSVSISITCGGGNIGRAIYIDWNNDYQFSVDEAVYSSNAEITGTSTGTFNVPTNQAIGNYRMRVITNELMDNPEPCSYFLYGEVEDYTFQVVAAPAPSTNDVICGAQTLKPSNSSALNTYGAWSTTMSCDNRNVNTAGSSASDLVESSCGGTNGKSVWFKFTTPACVVGGIVPFQIEMSSDNSGTNYNTKMELFSSSNGTCGGTLTSIICNDDLASVLSTCGSSSANPSTIIQSNLSPNTTYFLLIDGYNGASGDVEVSGRVLAEPHTTTAISPTQLAISTADKGASLYTYYVRQVGSSGYTITNSTNLTKWPSVANGYSYQTQIMYRCTSASSQFYRTPLVTVDVPVVSACTSLSDLNCTPNGGGSYTINWSSVPGLYTNGGALSGYIVYYRVIGSSGYSYNGNPSPTCSGATCSYTLTGLNNPNGYEFWIKTRCSATIQLQSNTATCVGTKSAITDLYSFTNPTTETEYVDVSLTDNWSDFGLTFADYGSYYVGINKENEIYALKTAEPNMINAGADISFELVPNPTNASTTLTFNNTIKSGTFQVVDAMGRNILSGDISNTNAIELDGSNWNAGVYLVNVTTNDKTTMRRLVISK